MSEKSAVTNKYEFRQHFENWVPYGRMLHVQRSHKLLKTVPSTAQVIHWSSTNEIIVKDDLERCRGDEVYFKGGRDIPEFSWRVWGEQRKFLGGLIRDSNREPSEYEDDYPNTTCHFCGRQFEPSEAERHHNAEGDRGLVVPDASGRLYRGDRVSPGDTGCHPGGNRQVSVPGTPPCTPETPALTSQKLWGFQDGSDTASY